MQSTDTLFYLGTGKNLDVKPFNEEIQLPADLRIVLFNKFCVLPALADLPNPPLGKVYKKFYTLELCTFLSKMIAESGHCDGLQLFHNINKITEEKNFCQRRIGKFVLYL